MVHDFDASAKTLCPYCGSMSIEEAFGLLSTPGTSYSGSDWKYGWPHKFYIGNGKFYSIHMTDATTGQLKRWNGIAQPRLGIGFFKTEGGRLLYSAVSTGYQTWGRV